MGPWIIELVHLPSLVNKKVEGRQRGTFLFTLHEFWRRGQEHKRDKEGGNENPSIHTTVKKAHFSKKLARISRN